jgi:sialic acid synthase SpsE
MAPPEPRRTVHIGDREIGPGYPVYVIAEIGSNHDGDLNLACDLIETAAAAGADCAKFQFYRADELYPGKVTPGAIPDDWLPVLKRVCEGSHVDFLCSVFSGKTLAAYLEVEPSAVKIASPEATDHGLLASARLSGLPVICATGACTQEDVDAVRYVLGRCPHILLHCVSAYPAEPDEMNLSAIREMTRRYGVPVGLSDHTTDQIIVPALAVAAGACVIEKHLTHAGPSSSPDHDFSLRPVPFARMVKDIRYAEAVMGDGVKRVMPSEDPHDRR